MNILNNFLFSNPQLLNLWLLLTDERSGQFSGILKRAAAIGAAVIALFLIISITKGAVEYSKGGGTGGVGKILGQVIFLFICIGLIFVVLNYNSWIGIGEKVGNTVLNETSQLVDGVGGGTSGN